MKLKIIAVFSIILFLTVGVSSADENIADAGEIPQGETLNITEDIDLTSEIEISQPTTVYGNNHVISAQNTRIFKITSDNVTLRDIIFKNGFSNDSGGSVFTLKGLNIINCTFINSSTEGSGAVYSASEDELNVVNSTFIESRRGAIWSNSKVNSITGCRFETSYWGDGVVSLNGSDITKIENCIFDKMDSEAVYLNNSNEASITGCSFTNYGYIYSEDYSPDTPHSNAIFSDSKSLNINGCSFENPYSQGGAIRAFGEITNIINTKFANTTSYDEYIGSVYLESKNNTITNCSFENSETIYTIGNTTKIEKCEFTKSSIASQDRTLCTIEECNFNNGGVYVDGTSKIMNSTFINCTGTFYGAIYAHSNVSITNCLFDNCTSELRGEVHSEELQTNSILLDEGCKAVIENCFFTPSTGNIIEYFNTVINESTDNIKIIKKELKLPESADVGDSLIIKADENIENKIFELYVNDTLVSKAVANSESVIIFRTTLKNGMTKAYIKSARDDNYFEVNSEIMLNVSRDLIIEADDVVKYYGGEESFNARVTNGDGEPIANEKLEIRLNGETYTRTTLENGRINPLPLNLNSAEYKLLINDRFEYFISVMPTIKADDVTKVFRNATNYTAKFIDSKGNPLSPGLKVDININGVFYQRTVKEDGSISFTLNLAQGEYVLTTKNPVTGEYIANNVTIIPRIVENHDLVKYYRNESQYTFQLLNDYGYPAEGEVASININGVFYKRTTGFNGMATFQINLNPGEYILTVEYKGCRVSNKVTVLDRIEGSDLSGKYGSEPEYKVRILDETGNPLPNQKIMLNINGVVYNRTTNENGTASMKIRLMAGEYIITTYFNELRHSNKITIT